MARTKPQNDIMTKQEAEDAMRRLDEIDRRFADWDLSEAKAVSRVRERFNEKRKAGGYVGLEAERKLLAKELQAWAEADKTHWRGKTLPLKHGSIGYRVSAPAVRLRKSAARSFAAALDLVKSAFKEPDRYIRVKEELDKEAILAVYREGRLTAGELTEAGLRVEQKNEFWIETVASKDLEEAMRRLKAA